MEQQNLTLPFDIHLLTYKFLNDTVTEAEKHQLENWLEKDAENRQRFIAEGNYYKKQIQNKRNGIVYSVVLLFISACFSFCNSNSKQPTDRNVFLDSIVQSTTQTISNEDREILSLKGSWIGSFNEGHTAIELTIISINPSCGTVDGYTIINKNKQTFKGYYTKDDVARCYCIVFKNNAKEKIAINYVAGKSYMAVMLHKGKKECKFRLEKVY